MRKFYFITGLFLTAVLSLAQNREVIRKIDSLNNLSYDQLINTPQNDIKKYISNLELAKQADYPKGIADTYASLSMIYYYKGNYDISTDYFFKAVNQYKSIGDMSHAAALYGLYGYRFRRTDLKKAVEYMRIGIKMAEAENADGELLALYDNYGVVKEDLGDYDSAFYFYNKSLSMKRKAGDEVGIPYSLNKIAALKSILGEYDEAKKIFDEAYERRLQLGDKIGIAENLNFYGTFYQLQNDTDNAMKYFKQSLEISKEAGYNYLTQSIYSSLSENSAAGGDYKNAFEYLKEQMVYKDSIYNMESAAHRQQLEVQFETEEKEKKILEQRANLAEQKLELQKKNIFLLGLLFLILLTALAAYLINRNQKLKNRQLIRENELKDELIKIEAQNRVQQERLRISRDLHDNIGSQLTFIISSLDNLKFRLAKENPDAGVRLNEINQFTRNTINELRDTIWAMNKNHISFPDLRIRVNKFIENARMAAPQINFVLEFTEDENETAKFSALRGINIYRLIQEAINNAIKHADATEIKISMKQSDNSYKIEVEDNGKGISTDELNHGNGMSNMQNRISEIGGELKIDSKPGKGTKLIFEWTIDNGQWTIDNGQLTMDN